MSCHKVSSEDTTVHIQETPNLNVIKRLSQDTSGFQETSTESPVVAPLSTRRLSFVPPITEDGRDQRLQLVTSIVTKVKV